jgi:hypothetical protein
MTSLTGTDGTDEGRTMQRILMLFALVAGLAFGSAVAQDVTIDGESAEIRQAITVDIPERYALHLSNDAWLLDLDNLDDDVACYLVPKDVEFDFLQFKRYQAAWYRGELALEPTSHYPAVILDEYGNVAIGDDGEYQKGTLVCFFQKVLQKFTNVPDWQLHVLFTADRAGFGNFQLIDYLDDLILLGVATDQASAFAFADRPGTTGGWLDDLLVEGFWFDGSEVANDYRIEVTFTLSAAF